MLLTKFQPSFVPASTAPAGTVSSNQMVSVLGGGGGGAAFTVNVMLRLAVVAFASRTCIVTALLLTVVGVPLITPVTVFRLNPAGKLPTTKLQVYGAMPPLAVNGWL